MGDDAPPPDSSPSPDPANPFDERVASPTAGRPDATHFDQDYRELHQLARQQMAGERRDHTLQATALVHEAYMRLRGRGVGQMDRPMFFHAAAAAMRRILVDHARSRHRQKRGGPEARRLPASVLDLIAAPDASETLAVEEALEKLERESPELAAVVRLRFYGGLSVNETAEALRRSPRSIDRDWSYARAWLFDALNVSSDTPPP